MALGNRSSALGRWIRRLTIAVVALALGSTAGGLAFSKWYWGYWMSPPTVLSWLKEPAIERRDRG